MLVNNVNSYFMKRRQIEVQVSDKILLNTIIISHVYSISCSFVVLPFAGL